MKKWPQIIEKISKQLRDNKTNWSQFALMCGKDRRYFKDQMKKRIDRINKDLAKIGLELDIKNKG